MLSARLIQSGLSDAATNMATDEAIFLLYKENISTPTLRIYGWRPPAISIGYSQNPSELINLDACRREGIAVVRRLTGGGIIFHDRELTYSVVLSQADIGTGYRVKESFEVISSFLIKLYKNLGARACFAKDTQNNSATGHIIAPFCFSRNESYDILVEGKKLGGNAQKRRRSIILQHGSIPLAFDKDKVKPLLKNPNMLQNLNIASIHEISKDKMNYDTLSQALSRAFSSSFKTILKTEELTTEETKLAQNLKDTKYNSCEWNLDAAFTPARVA